MERIRTGWSMRDVSTLAPVNIPGQFNARISKGIIDPVTATALVIDGGRDQDSAVFVSIDAVVIRSNLLDEVRAKTALLNSEIPVDKIMMNATHTHTGASHYEEDVSASVWGGGMNTLNKITTDIEIASSDEYRHYLSDTIAEMINEAWIKRDDSGISWGYGYAVVAHSRRTVYFDDVSKRDSSSNRSGMMVNGHGVMYGNTNDDKFSHYEAGSDHIANFMFTFDRNNTLTGAIVNIPCPSQCSEHEWRLSADYWHDTRKAIREKFGDIFILPQCAAAGDLSPRILHYKKAQERRFRLKYGSEDAYLEDRNRRDIAERITESFDEVFSWAKRDIHYYLPVKHNVETVELSKRMITAEEYENEKKSLEDLNAKSFASTGSSESRLVHDTILAASRSRCEKIIKRYETQTEEPKLPMEMHTLRVGDIAFATNRFELYMDYMHRIQARSPFEQTFVIQLSAVPGPDGGTYLATERGAEDKGYSACLYCNLVSPQGGQELVEATLASLEKMKD